MTTEETTKCWLGSNGVQIDPATEDDYRKLKDIRTREVTILYLPAEERKNLEGSVLRCEHRNDNSRNQRRPVRKRLSH